MVKAKSRSGKIHLISKDNGSSIWTSTLCGLSIDALERWEEGGPDCNCKKCAKKEIEQRSSYVKTDL